MLEKFFLWLTIVIERRHGADMIMCNYDGHHLLVAGTKAAGKVMTKRFGKRYKRVLGGYILLPGTWKRVYDALHHGPCPIAVWI